MTGSMASLLDEIMGDHPYPGKWHPMAMRACVENWGREMDEHPDRGRKALYDRAYRDCEQQLRDDGYGFVLLTFLLFTAIAAALSWAIERLLDWLYPKNSASAVRQERLLELRWRQ